MEAEARPFLVREGEAEVHQTMIQVARPLTTGSASRVRLIRNGINCKMSSTHSGGNWRRWRWKGKADVSRRRTLGYNRCRWWRRRWGQPTPNVAIVVAVAVAHNGGRGHNGENRPSWLGSCWRSASTWRRAFWVHTMVKQNSTPSSLEACQRSLQSYDTHLRMPGSMPSIMSLCSMIWSGMPSRRMVKYLRAQSSGD